MGISMDLRSTLLTGAAADATGFVVKNGLDLVEVTSCHVWLLTRYCKGGNSVTSFTTTCQQGLSIFLCNLHLIVGRAHLQCHTGLP